MEIMGYGIEVLVVGWIDYIRLLFFVYVVVYKICVCIELLVIVGLDDFLV